MQRAPHPPSPPLPLTRTNVPPAMAETVDTFIDFAGCTLDIVFSERQIAALQQACVAGLSGGDPPAAAEIQDHTSRFRPLRSAPPEARAQWRAQYHGPFVARCKSASHPLWSNLAKWDREAREVIAQGHVPLTREGAESFIELVIFANAVARGLEPSQMPPNDLEAAIGDLRRNYPAAPGDQQALVQNAPPLLYEIRRAWPTMQPQERAALRQEWATQLGLPQGPPGYGGPPTGPAYGYPQGAPPGAYPPQYGAPPPSPYAPAYGAPAAPPGYPAPAAYGAPAPGYGGASPAMAARAGADPYGGIPDPETRELMRQAFGDEPKRDTPSLMAEMNAAQKQGDDARAAELQLQIQKNAQDSQVASQMLSNLTRMRYDSMKSIANNMH